MKNKTLVFILSLLLISSFNNLNALPSTWNYSITINSHVILIQPSTQITIDGIQIEVGDYIGVFYMNTSGNLNCAGYMEYQGSMSGLSVWPVDLGNDGFQSGDAIIWKIWASSTNTEHISEAEYDISGAFPNFGFFAENGMSGIISINTFTNNIPWNYNITGTNHSVLVPENALITIDGNNISHGDYLGVFFDSAGVLLCAGYVQWLGYMTSFSAWGEDIGNDGFISGEEFTWKIWDNSNADEFIAHPYYMGPPMPNQEFFIINGMSGIDSLKFVQAPWDYTVTATNHTILLPQDGTYLINNTPMSVGDYVGVFYDSLGTLICGGYSIWEGVNTTIAAWGEDIGNDGFVVGEEFKWKVWNISDGIEYYASSIYLGSPLPNQGNYVMNGMSGVDTLLVVNNPPNWNYSITGTNHTILIPELGNYTGINGPIAVGDFIGVFYDSLGTLACGGYTQWFGLSTTIAAWGEDLGNDGFSSGENFIWKIWDISAGVETIVAATYIQPPIMPNTGQFISNGMSGIETLDIYQPSPTWSINNTGSNHTILIPENIDILLDNMPIVSGDFIGVFYDSLGTPTCAGFIEYNGITIALTAWGEDIGNDGFALGEEFTWMIWDASEDSVWLVYAEYDLTFINQQYYDLNGISSLTSITSVIPIETQDIILNNGWGIYSTYIIPTNPDMDSVFFNIIQYTEMCKNANGSIFWPAFNVNLIGNIEVGEGYLIKMNTQQTLSITGMVIIPETTGIFLNSGWDMIAFLRKTPSAIAIVMDPIVTSIALVKDGDGNLFWPQYFLDLIGSMYPGKGYQIKMNSPEVLYYPANIINTTK